MLRIPFAQNSLSCCSDQRATASCIWVWRISFNSLKIRISHEDKSGMHAVCFEHLPPPSPPSYDIQLVSNCFVELTEGWWTIIPSPLCGIYSWGTSECHAMGGRLRLKCGGTHAETRFRLSTKRTRSFTSQGASVQSTTGSRGVRISGSNAG